MRVDDVIGQTRMVRLARVVPEGAAEVWVKLEGQNPGGSVKDRPARFMLDAAEAEGLLRPGGTVVEPTSGNTGIALAMLGAARGYRVILTMPASMSEERKRILRAFGAELELTDPAGGIRAAIAEARRIAEATGAYMPNQFENPANPRAHEATTGPEIYSALKGRVDAFVSGSGTGGSLTGVGRYLKHERPRVRVVLVEPARRPAVRPGPKGTHGFQGMGPGFVPKNLDLDLVDEVVLAKEEDAFPLGLRLARKEGLFLGPSSMANVWAAIEVARRLGPGRRVVTLAPDFGYKYLSVEPYASSP